MSIRRATSADFVIWLQKQYWHVSEAAWLFSGLEPDSVRNSDNWDPEAFPRLGDASFRREEECFASFFPLFDSEPRFKNPNIDRLAPMEWINWANGHGLALPPELVQAAGARSNELPDKATHEGAMAASDRSGGPGAPSSMHLVLGEFKRRAAAGHPAENVTAESEFLSRWLNETYPLLRPLTPKTIKNNIAALFREMKRAPENK